MDINLFLCDIDGTLTNGGYFVSTNATEPNEYFRQFNTSDFVGIEALEKAGIEVATLTGSHSPCLAQFDRAAPFMKVHSAVFDKYNFVKAFFVDPSGHNRAVKYKWEEIAFIGDELNDGRLLSKVGLAACPADAAPEVYNLVKNRSDGNGFIMSRNGGHRAVREFTDMIRKMMNISTRWGDWVYPEGE